MTFWLNGEFLQATDAIDIADRGFLLGDGVFETILVVNGVPAFLDAHLDRLRAAVTAFSIKMEIEESIGAVIRELAARNNLSKRRASARLTVTRGAGSRGLLFPDEEQAHPTVLLAIHKSLPAPAPEPLALMVSKYARSEIGVTSRHKTINYLDNILARHEAALHGCGDAVMLNGARRVACVSAANIFAIDDDGAAATPHVSEGALPGIVRGLLLGGAKETGVPVKEAQIEQTALAQSTLFITNSLLGVRPALMKSETVRRPSAAGKALRRLQSWYDDALKGDLEKRASAF